MNSELSNLNPHSFERLVRALALHSLGLSGTVYSAGADGGRDFTIEGEIKGYEAVGWNGYLVLQCKFRETKTGDKDPEWLIKQLEDEREQFLSQRSARRTPDYYVLATNISLSGADSVTRRGVTRKGGMSKVQDALDTWKSDLGISGYDVWPQQKIVDLLSLAPEVKRSYAAWVTPGDVLGEVLSQWASRRPEFERVVRRSLINSVRRSQYTSLKDAGSVSDEKIRTGQVFIDLPYSIGPRFIQNGFHAPDAEPRLIRDLVSRATDKLDPESIAERRALQAGKQAHRNRIVILGGPGQGKSTAATFLAQVFRSALVSSDAEARFDDTAVSLVPEILARAATEKISTNLPRRYPVLVQLPRFADAVTAARQAKGSLPSLLSFVAESLSEDGDDTVSREDLRGWLARYPWVVVLDGLDEVPPSGERAAVLDAISGLLTEIGDARADALIVVTTRPQGYNRDLDPAFWEHWQLSDLGVERALAYASALGEARYPDDKSRREEIHKKLVSAGNEPATARLMVSPLQVTILYLIVDTGGSAPTARWTLFNEYYEVLRRREKSKGGDLQAILERNWAFIGPIHQRAGLLLQALSEMGGSAQAAFDRTSFERLVREYLALHGFSGGDLESRASELAGVALNRLVLLSAREEGSIRFDVRSLQEFMAAAALTSGETREVEARLLHLAGIAHWRHTLLIAASRCFAEDAFHHRRAAIVALTRSLDASPPDQAVANGARLALEMFADGISVDYPVFRRVLAAHAIETLSLGTSARSLNVDRLWQQTVQDVTMEGIRRHLHSGNLPQRKAAWQMLLSLAAQDPFALDILRAEWPADSEAVPVDYFDSIDLPPPGDFRDWLRTQLLAYSATSVLMLVERLSMSRSPSRAAWRSFLFPDLDSVRGFDFGLQVQGLTGVTVSVASVSRPGFCRVLLKSAIRFAGASAIKAVCEFAISPTENALGDALEALAQENFDTAKGGYYFAPWPLVTAIEFATKSSDFAYFAEAARRGDLGSYETWIKAESRWQDQGISREDLLIDWGSLPISPEIAERGAPTLRLLSIHHGEGAEAAVREILAVLADGPPPHRAAELAEMLSYLTYALERQVPDAEVDRDQLIDAITVYRLIDVDLSLLSLVWPADSVSREEAAALARLGEGFIINSGEPSTVSPQQILDTFLRFPESRGLLYLLLLTASADDEKRPIDLSRASAGVFEPSPDDPPRIRASALCLQIAASGPAAVPPAVLAEAVFNMTPDDNRHAFSEALDTIVGCQLLPDNYLIDFLMALLPMLGDAFLEREPPVRAQLKIVLDRRKSNILSPIIWHEALLLPPDALTATMR